MPTSTYQVRPRYALSPTATIVATGPGRAPESLDRDERLDPLENMSGAAFNRAVNRKPFSRHPVGSPPGFYLC